MTKELVTILQHELSEFAKELAKKHNINLARNNASYTSDEVKFNVLFEDLQMSDHTQKLGQMYDFPEVGSTYIFKGLKTEVVGYDFGRRKYDTKVKDSNGRIFLMNHNDIAKLIERTKGQKPSEQVAAKVLPKVELVNGSQAEWMTIEHKGTKVKVLFVKVITSHGKEYNQYKTEDNKLIHQVIK